MAKYTIAFYDIVTKDAKGKPQYDLCHRELYLDITASTDAEMREKAAQDGSEFLEKELKRPVKSFKYRFSKHGK